MDRRRRDWLKATAALAAAGGWPLRARAGARPRVAIVGGGFGGATAAKYLRLWSGGAIDVVLVERNERLVSGPMSNRVVSGDLAYAAIVQDYALLERKWGVTLIRDEVVAVDPLARRLRLARGSDITADRLVLAPGIGFAWDELPWLPEAERESVLHGWIPGPQTVELRRRLAALPDGGTVVLGVPRAPYRCPPGPYERASLVADYLRRRKPRSKVLVLDANPAIQAKAPLFEKAWRERYRGLIEYQPNSRVESFDRASGRLRHSFGMLRPALVNLIPPQRAGALARLAGLPTDAQGWVQVDGPALEARGLPGVHMLGDAVSVSPGFPKSAHMANQQGKQVAAAIIDLFAGREPQPSPVVTNVCYSFLSASHAAHIAQVYRYSPPAGRMERVSGAGGVSVASNELEAGFALDWARNLWVDTLA
jgi:sulfite dehydrogenase